MDVAICRLCLALACVGALWAPAGAEEQPAVNIDAEMARLRDETQPAERFRPGEEFLAWRQRVRGLLRQRLGVPEQSRHLLAVREEPAEEVETHGLRYRRQRVLLQTEPALWVPAYVCLPLNAKGKLPAIIGCQGHAAEGIKLSVGLVKDADYDAMITNGDRDYPLQAVRHGCIGVALEMRGFGELRTAEDLKKNAGSSCTTLHMLALQVGRTLIGMRVHDIMAAVDYLQERPDVEPGKIVLTGNSGGGTATFYAAALEDRLAASIPSCAFCTYRASIQAMHHCPCNYLPGMSALIDMDDMAGLAAPRPQLILSGKTDAIFPQPGVQEAFARLKGIYAAAGAPDRLRLYVGDGGHRYYAQPVWPFLRELGIGE